MKILLNPLLAFKYEKNHIGQRRLTVRNIEDNFPSNDVLVIKRWNIQKARRETEKKSGWEFGVVLFTHIFHPPPTHGYTRINTHSLAHDITFNNNKYSHSTRAHSISEDVILLNIV